MTIGDIVFVGFNRRVFALDREDGTILWSWKAPQGSGYVSLLLDGDRLIASVNGYMYCLDPRDGRQMWANPMKGFGIGVASIATIRGTTPSSLLAKAANDAAAAAGGASAAGGSS